MPSDNSKKLKVVILGDSGAGKSALCHALVGDHFNNERKPTLGVGYFLRTNQDKTVQLSIWDPSGDSRYSEVVQYYYKNPDILIYCFDSSCAFNEQIQLFKTTLKKVLDCQPESDDVQEQIHRAPIELFFVATKVTAETRNNIPTPEALQALVAQLPATINPHLNCISTNAESGLGIQNTRQKTTCGTLENQLFEFAQSMPSAVPNVKKAEVQNEPQPTNACFTLGVLSSIAAVGSVAAVVALVILAVPLPFIMIPVATTIACGAAAGLFFFASRNASKDALEEAPNPQVWGSDL